MFKTAKRPFDREDMLDDDKVAFYTGLPTLKLLDALYGHIAPHITRRSLQDSIYCTVTWPTDLVCPSQLYQEFFRLG